MPRVSARFPSLAMLRQERNHGCIRATASFLFEQRHVCCRNMAIHAATHNSSDVFALSLASPRRRKRICRPKCSSMRPAGTHCEAGNLENLEHLVDWTFEQPVPDTDADDAVEPAVLFRRRLEKRRDPQIVVCRLDHLAAGDAVEHI